MSKKDVLHIPLPEEPRTPERTANPEHEEEGHPQHVPPMHPHEGPGGLPGRGGDPLIITPQPSSIPYPGVGVS